MTIATNAAKINAPDKYMGADVPFPGIFAARTGAMRPITLFKKLAMPVPAPRTGAGLHVTTTEVSAIYSSRSGMIQGEFEGDRKRGGGGEENNKKNPESRTHKISGVKA